MNLQIRKALQRAKETQCRELLELLLEVQTPFRIIVINKGIEYTPQLPPYIMKNLRDEILIFDLAKYTLSTGQIVGRQLVFEAGFGRENVGAEVSIPLGRISTIYSFEVDASIFINPFSEEEPAETVSNPRLVLK